MDIELIVDFAAYKRPSKTQTGRMQRAVLETLFEALTRINVAYLLATPNAPLLYESGVFYEREFLPERWLDIPSIRREGHDDCEGLACWLAAEMRVRAPNSVGPRKRPAAGVVLKEVKPGQYHAVVLDRETGQVFDPSKQLGM